MAAAALPIGHCTWVTASIFMSVWILRFGIGLLRAPEARWVRT